MRYYPAFRRAIPHYWVDSYVLLTRLPLDHILLYNPARLACLRHTASVHPEPGSNSQKKSTELIFCSDVPNGTSQKNQISINDPDKNLARKHEKGNPNLKNSLPLIDYQRAKKIFRLITSSALRQNGKLRG